MDNDTIPFTGGCAMKINPMISTAIPMPSKYIFLLSNENGGIFVSFFTTLAIPNLLQILFAFRF